MLLRLNRLVQTVAVAAAGQDTTRKIIDNQNLVILNHIVVVSVEEVMRLEREVDVVLNLKVLRIREVLDAEELLDLASRLPPSLPRP